MGGRPFYTSGLIAILVLVAWFGSPDPRLCAAAPDCSPVSQSLEPRTSEPASAAAIDIGKLVLKSATSRAQSATDRIGGSRILLTPSLHSQPRGGTADALLRVERRRSVRAGRSPPFA